MGRLVFLKSVLRRPVRTLLLALLVGFISYAFIARAAQFAIVERETERLAGYYRAIGFLVPDDPNRYDVSEGVEIVSASEYVSFEDGRRYAPAALEGLLNADVDGSTGAYLEKDENGNYTNRYLRTAPHISDVFFYGVLTQKYDSNNVDNGLSCNLGLTVDTVVAGYPEYVEPGRDVWVEFDLASDAAAALAADMEIGKRYFIKAYYHRHLGSFNGIDWRYAWEYLVMAPFGDAGFWYLPVEPGAEIDLGDPGLAGLREELELLRENQSAVLVCASADLSAMPDVQQSSRCYYLTDGRWPNAADSAAANPVCAVHQEFAQLRGLSVGDTIALHLRDMPLSYYGYIIEKDDEEIAWYLEGNADADWREYPVSRLALTIAGIYGYYNPNIVSSTSDNLLVFIPDSAMPEEYGGQEEMLYSSSYSFVLGSAKNQDAFIAETKDALATLGLSVGFVENNAANFFASTEPLRQAAATDAFIWGAVLTLALALAAFLYLRSHRKEFAILRALGMPRSIACARLLSPIALIGFIAVLAGGVASWRYALDKAAETLGTIVTPEGARVEAGLSPAYLAAFCAAAFALLMLFALAGILALARRPALELLQGGEKKAGAKRARTADGEADPAPAFAATVPGAELSSPAYAPARGAPGRYGAGGAAYLRFALRQMLRAPLKSGLSLAVAALFVFSLGWMRDTMARNGAEIDRLYGTTVVEAEIVKLIPSTSVSDSGGAYVAKSTVDAVLEGGYAGSAYLVAASEWALLAAPGADTASGVPYDKKRSIRSVTLCAFDDAEAFFAHEGANASVEYAQGYDSRFFSVEWDGEALADASPPVVVSAQSLSLLGLRLWSPVYLVDGRGEGLVQRCVIAGVYTGKIQAQSGENAVLLSRALLEALGAKNDQKTCYMTARFLLDPAKNRDLAQAEAELTALAERPNAGLLDLRFVFWDEELKRVVEPMEKNLRLMAALYPAAVALSALIAAGLAALLLAQSAREAAILRALGAKKRSVRVALMFERIALTLAGLALGLAALAILRGSVNAALSGASLLCAGAYLAGTMLGTGFAAIPATNRPPLSLLQVKE